VNILNDPANIGIPDGPITFHFNTTNINNSEIIVPFNITNDGYFELTDLTVRIRVNMSYYHYDGIGPTNESRTVIIFDSTQGFPRIQATNIFNGNLSSDSGDFIEGNIPNPQNISFISSEPVGFYVDLFLSASYSLNLLSFRIEIYNISTSII
jgi:hypothetical protein